MMTAAAHQSAIDYLDVEMEMDISDIDSDIREAEMVLSAARKTDSADSELVRSSSEVVGFLHACRRATIKHINERKAALLAR